MVTLLFGAGASFGSGSCSPYLPPLGKDLFDKLNQQGGFFTKLDYKTKAIFIEKGFEAGMACIEDDSRKITPLQKEIACYLSKFTVKNDNSYVRLFNKLGRDLKELTISTLNYDLLIEQAISLNYYNVDYNGLGGGVTLLKPHGSSNFLPKLPDGFNISGNVFKNCDSYFSGLQTEAVSNNQEVKDWCSNPKNSDLSPVLALYQKGKRVVINSDLINDIQKKYVNAIDKSSLIFVVGVKYVEHDHHIWDSLSSSNAQVVIVDPYPEDTIRWADTHSLQNVEVMYCGFDEAVIPMARMIKKHLRGL